ncbi:MAG: hemagglutinin repeat-containing protein, partial [Alphaproteobacteria bacterium]|nr:hemagglutinin repeat-containing protein [Alphaproteobacteria bacterium]
IYVEASQGGIEAPTLQGHAGKELTLSAQDNIDLSSRVETYVSERWEKSGFLWFSSSSGMRESAEFTQTHLASGKTMSIDSKKGGINAQGSQFVSQSEDILMQAQKDILLNAVKATLHHREDDSSWWGLCGTSKHGYHQEAEVFGAKAHNQIRAYSGQGYIKGEGVQLQSQKISIHGEKGIALNELQLEQFESIKNYGLDLSIFGVNVFRPSRSKGPNNSISLGYSQDTQTTETSQGRHGILHAKTVEVSTGQDKESKVDLRGMNAKVNELISDTNELLLGGSEQTTKKNSEGFGFSVGWNLATETPEVGMNIYSQKNTLETFQKALVSIGTFTNKRKESTMNISNGIEGGIEKSRGETMFVNIDHAQSKESQEGGNFGVSLGAENMNLSVGANWGSKTSLEGLTNFTWGKDTSNLVRKNIHHKNTDTRGGFGVSVGISKEGVDVGVQVQVGDQSFGMSTQTIKDIFSLGKDISNLSSFQRPTNLTQLVDTTNSLLETVDKTQNLLQNMDIPMPEEVQKVVNTAKQVGSIAKFVDQKVLNETFWKDLGKGIQEFKLPQTFDDFLSQSKEGLSKVADTLSEAQKNGIPIPGELSNALQGTVNVLSKTQGLTEKMKTLDFTSFPSSFTGEFSDLLKNGHQVLNFGKELQNITKKMGVPLPKEWTSALDKAHQVVNTTDTLYNNVSQNAFLKSFNIDSNIQFPESFKDGIELTQSFLNTTQQTGSFLKDLGVDIMPEGVSQFMTTAQRIVNLTEKIEKNFSVNDFQKAFEEFKLPQTFGEVVNQGTKALSKVTKGIEKFTKKGGIVPSELSKNLEYAQILLMEAEKITNPIGNTEEALFSPKAFSDLLNQGQSFTSTASKIQKALEEIKIPLPEEWTQSLQTAQELISSGTTLQQGFYQEAFLKTLQEGNFPSFLKNTFSATHIPTSLSEGIETAQVILNNMDQMESLLSTYGIE